ncbi:SCF ubiquitin ligase complex subunit [Rhizina undulata]
MARHRLATRTDLISGTSSSSSSPERMEQEDSDGFMGRLDDSYSSIGELTNFRNMTVSPTSKSGANRKPKSPRKIGPISKLPQELLIAIFGKIGSPLDLRSCMLVSKLWTDCCVELLWHRPYFSNFKRYQAMAAALSAESPFYTYAQLIRRLNLTFIANEVNDGTMEPLTHCTRLERLTLMNCSKLTDSPLMEILKSNPRMQALDLSQLELITDLSLNVIANNCPRLQGLNVAGCKLITDASLIPISLNCKYLRRLKLSECNAVTNAAVISLANNCPQLLELDLHKCHCITDEAVMQLFLNLRQLRELRLAFCEQLTDTAFLQLPPNKTYDSLRVLDLTNCECLTDESVDKIITIAPRLRQIVLAKCRNITDKAVNSICRLEKNLHYIHLGHCQNITDRGVKNLVQYCNRIRYIDLACCIRITDTSVVHLAQLTKLKRIGLVKCNNITDLAIQSLVRRMNTAPCPLERVHLSYCMNLTVLAIHELINNCQRLTHLSLTGVEAFYRSPDYTQFCRQPPKEFNSHQREVFCVFSGPGVYRLRAYLNRHLTPTINDNGEPTYFGEEDDPQINDRYEMEGEGGTDEIDD